MGLRLQLRACFLLSLRLSFTLSARVAPLLESFWAQFAARRDAMDNLRHQSDRLGGGVSAPEVCARRPTSERQASSSSSRHTQTLANGRKWSLARKWAPVGATTHLGEPSLAHLRFELEALRLDLFR